MKPSELTPRQGKVLRYVVARDRNAKEIVEQKDCITKIKWSDLPQSLLQAKVALRRLEVFGLVQKQGKGYVPTKDGIKLIKAADKQGLWQTPPPPSITNRRRR